VRMHGTCANALLRAVSHVPCIRIMRPFEKRVQWLMAELDTDDRDLAEKEIQRSDEANASRMNEQFGVTWGDPVLFDMVLNTDRLSVESCVLQVKSLLLRPEFAETAASLALLQGMALSARVRAALRGSETTEGVDVTIDANGGAIKLSGIVVSDDERAATEQVSSAVPGVTSVDNQLRVMKMSRLFPSAKN
jgi:Cytidylate kinase-like family/BON domain